MLEFLNTIREEHKDDESVLIAINEIENELTRKKYGLVWEEHAENVDIQMETKAPVFTEDKEREISALSEGRYNFLLEGDNLHSLRLLSKTHRNLIDFIYIDPPYNTGNNDFTYADRIVGRDDGFRHSKWLSFLSSRLTTAHSLLSPSGIIFISIDDNEQAPLKLLCDEIFGEDNFIVQFIWQKRTSPDARKSISTAHEYVLAYAKNKTLAEMRINKLSLDEKDAGKYKNPDNDPRGPWVSTDFGAQGYRPNQMYTITTPAGVKYTPPDGRCWKNTEDKFLQQVAEGRIWFGSDGKGVPRRKLFLSEREGKTVWSFLPNSEAGHSQEGTQELKKIFRTITAFDYPKPSRLIKRLLQIASQKDSVILDFFAGSGTTAQAVLELNHEDGGNRRFILCTNNENGICENVTYPRVKTVITGLRPDGSKYSDGIPANLKYYRTDFVPKSVYEMQDDLLSHIREMVQLEHGINLDNRQYVIIMGDDEADALEENWSEYPDLKGIYMSSDVLLTAAQQSLFEGIELNIIPEYYFEEELREVGQTL